MFTVEVNAAVNGVGVETTQHRGFTPEEIAEERFEMRAALGPGVEVVNIVTGERTIS